MESEKNIEIMFNNFLDMGEIMLLSGAEIRRVEDTLKRMAAASGMEQINVFVILSSIMLTVLLPDGRKMTQIRRIEHPARYNFTRIEAVNHLSREYCQGKLSLDEINGSLMRLKGENSVRRQYLGSIVTTGGFAIYFGGKWEDAVTAMAVAPCICWLQQHFEKYCPNKVIFHIFCSFFAGIVICLLSRWISAVHYDKVIAGDIMLMLPGLALMNSVRDVLAGNTISGIMRLTESMIWTGGLACGFMAAIWLIFHGGI